MNVNVVGSDPFGERVEQLAALYRRVTDDLATCFAEKPEAAAVRWAPYWSMLESPKLLLCERIHGTPGPRLSKRQPRGGATRYDLDADGEPLRAYTLEVDGRATHEWVRLSEHESARRAADDDGTLCVERRWTEDGRVAAAGSFFGETSWQVEEYEYGPDGRLTGITVYGVSPVARQERGELLVDELQHAVHWSGDTVALIEQLTPRGWRAMYAKLPGSIDAYLDDTREALRALLATLLAEDEQVVALQYDPEDPLPPHIATTGFADIATLGAELGGEALNPAEWPAVATEPEVPPELADRLRLLGRTLVAKRKEKRGVALLEEVAAEVTGVAAASFAYAIALEEDDPARAARRQVPRNRRQALKRAGLPL